MRIISKSMAKEIFCTRLKITAEKSTYSGAYPFTMIHAMEAYRRPTKL